MLTRTTLRWIATAWTVCLLYAALHRVDSYIPSSYLIHRLEHVFAFGVLAILLFPLCRNSGERWTMVAGFTVVAMMTELGEYLLFPQPFEWWDLRDDGLGFLLAFLLVRFTPISNLLLAE